MRGHTFDQIRPYLLERAILPFVLEGLNIVPWRTLLAAAAW